MLGSFKFTLVLCPRGIPFLYHTIISMVRRILGKIKLKLVWCNLIYFLFISLHCMKSFQCLGNFSTIKLYVYLTLGQMFSLNLFSIKCSSWFRNICWFTTTSFHFSFFLSKCIMDWDLIIMMSSRNVIQFLELKVSLLLKERFSSNVKKQKFDFELIPKG